MTREEEIQNAVANYDIYGRCQDPVQVFIDGAEWADANPVKSSIWHEPTEKHHFEFGITKQIMFQTLKGETFIGWAEDGCLGICYVSEYENEYLEAKYIKRWCYWKDALEVLDKN